MFVCQCYVCFGFVFTCVGTQPLPLPHKSPPPPVHLPAVHTSYKFQVSCQLAPPPEPQWLSWQLSPTPWPSVGGVSCGAQTRLAGQQAAIQSLCCGLHHPTVTERAHTRPTSRGREVAARDRGGGAKGAGTKQEQVREGRA